MPEKKILKEEEFNKFQKYCKDRGFDLAYFSEPDIDLEKALENEKAKIGVRRSKARPRIYDVAEWQREKWVNDFEQIYENFKKEVKE